MPQTEKTAGDRFRRALPVLTFVVGGIVGGVVVALAWGGGSSSQGSGSGGSSTGASPGATGEASGTSVTVPEACSRASDEVDRAVILIRRGVGAVQDFQPAELNRILDQLEVLDPRLRTLADECSAVQVDPTATAVPVAPGESVLTPGASPTPTLSPTPSPTP